MYARVRQLEMASQHRTESKVEEKETTEPLQKVFYKQTLQWDQQRVWTLSKMGLLFHFLAQLGRQEITSLVPLLLNRLLHALQS